jgi:hypothetical protein
MKQKHVEAHCTNHTRVVKLTICKDEFYQAVVAEWLRRLTRNQIPSGSAGSSPADCADSFIEC